MKTFLALLAALSCAFAQAAARPNADARAVVQHAFASVLEAGGFRGQGRGNVLGPGLPELSGEVEVVFPDRIHVRSDALEFIALRDRAWIDAFGVWTPTDRSLLPVTAFDVAAMRRAIASITDVRAEGAARMRQCAAHVFAFRSSGRLPGAAMRGDLRAWICDASGRPARVEANDAGGDHLVFDFDWTRRATVSAP